VRFADVLVAEDYAWASASQLLGDGIGELGDSG
jgi:hypothetical protein